MPRVTLQSRLPMIAAELRPRVSAAIKAGADDISEGAQTRVAVLTGALRDSIHTERVGPGAYGVFAGDEDVFYGHMVERGTKNMAPQPFLVPTAEESMDELEVAVAAALRSL